VDEFGLIAKYFSPLTKGYAGAHNLTDDAAFITPVAGKVLTVTTDTLVEGVHFLPHTAPDLVARKALRVNLSDLASKGAKPFAVMLNSVFPRDFGSDWIGRFAAGLSQDLDAFDCCLIGGDTVASVGPLTIGITAFGWSDPACCPHRSGAKAQDDIWVSGTIGDGGLGLLAAQGKLPDPGGALQSRYDLPEPRIALGQAIAPWVSAAMDISDGLLQDLGHIGKASGLGAEVFVSLIPLSASYGHSGYGGLAALTMGDDYELLFTAPADHADQLLRLAQTANVDITRIGRMMVPMGIICRDQDGQDVTPLRRGWQHFS
jgi:thiamine-monophosphate kinase